MKTSSKIRNTYIPEKYQIWWNDRSGGSLARVVKISLILWPYNINPRPK